LLKKKCDDLSEDLFLNIPSSIHYVQFVYMGLSLLGSFLILRWALNRMDPNKAAKEKAKDRKKQLSKRLGRPINLDGQYEDIIAQEVVNPRQIDVTLQDIGGLDEIIEDLQRNIITPMKRPEHFRTTLLRQKRGVLLYGPPGTGKTMLAKALARECDACFINLKASTILSKWYGDTNKLINAVWTLAYKIQPTILFIDEVDSLLGARRSMEHEATTQMKTEFMQLWEGFETMANNNVVVLGATNKREALDDAVLRRFSLQYEVKLPGVAERESILKLMLLRHATEVGFTLVDPLLLEAVQRHGVQQNGMEVRPRASSGDPRVRPLRDIAERTDGYSGSDLGELCSQAAAIPVHEYIAALERWEKDQENCAQPKLEALSKHHFEQVLAHMVPPSRAAQVVQARRRGGAGRFGSGIGMIAEHDIDALAAAITSGLQRGLRSPFTGHPINEEEEDSSRAPP
jgi:SpoVK/Ycf46/Vps4 family AAA+-type ATPase